MKARDVMKPFPRTVDVDDELGFARELMVWSGIRHLPVLRRGRLVGILSERDLLAYQVEASDRERSGLLDPVEAAMHPDPQTCAPDDALTDVIGRLAASRIGCLPVTEGGELVGIITVTDVLQASVHVAPQPTS